jgi:hypothetical protein
MCSERSTVMKTAAVWAVILLVLVGSPVIAAERILSPGDFFPEYRIQTDISTADAAYLGVSEDLGQKGYFVVEDAWGDVLVLELFNSYCYGCQKGAPVINRAYEMVASDPGLSRRVRFMGVGVGNSREAVDEFRSEFDVLFPLVPDPAFNVLDAIGNPGGTPYTMILRRTPSGFMLIRAHLGVLDSAGSFVDEIREISGGDMQQLLAGGEPAGLVPWIEKRQTPPMTEKEVEDQVLGSMDRAGYGSVGLYSVALPDGEKVFIGESGRGKVFSKVVTRLPVCDVCHPVHFILTVNTSGKVVDFDAITVTKYWNRPWTEGEVEKMRQNLLGLSVLEDRVFDPSVDAVSTATMSSSLIFDSLQSLGPVMELLKKAGHL